jgi:hypothetical protein
MFWGLSLREPEKDAAFHLSNLLSNVARQCHDFEAAVHLFAASGIESQAAMTAVMEAFGEPPEARAVLRQRLDVFNTWKRFAAEAAILALYHFRETTHGVFSAMRTTCPTICAKIDAELHSQANKLFDAKFPRYAEARHAVAHAAHRTTQERWRTDAKLAERVEAAGYAVPANTIISSGITGDQYVFSSNGSLVTVNINLQAAADLAEVARLLFAGFDPCEKQRK